MERIQTGTTGERKIRTAIFVAMMVVFAVFFYKDWKWGYAAKNLEKLKEKLPVTPAKPVATNPAIMRINLEVLKKKIEEQRQSMTREEVQAALGEPAAEEMKEGKQYLYYIGPAVYATLVLSDGKLVYHGKEVVLAEETTLHPEASIGQQGLFFKVLVVLSVLGMVQLIRVIRTNVVVDDEGLIYNGQKIAWDAMIALNSARYREKGWVDLEYKDGEETDTLRIDNYKVNAFRPVVSAICEKKGFTVPFDQAK